MKGLELSRAFFKEYGQPMIERQFPDYKEKIAAGLVGEGSECLGFDDEISQDHDFGPGFCMWVPEAVYEKVGPHLQTAYEGLPKEYRGYRREETQQGTGRLGAFSIEQFYHKYTGCGTELKDNMQWFRIPERFLSTVASGAVFCDPLGEFTRVRNQIKAFYPMDVLKKKLAARAAIMAQAGQYNYLRCTKRSDYRAAFLACAEFVKAGLSAVYLLNRQYMPFYKWAFRATESLSLLGSAVSDLSQLALLEDSAETKNKKQLLIETICTEVGKELNRQGFSQTKDPFLQNHCPEIMGGITDSTLRSLHVMADCD